MPMIDEFLTHVDDRSARVGIFGLGYVGLPLSLVFSENGFSVLGFDIEQEKLDQLSLGKSYVRHIEHSRVAAAVDSGRFVATTDFERTSECDALIVCVPTPLSPNREPDLTYVIRTTEQISAHLRPGQLFSLESTTYPGTTDGELLPILEQRGMKAGRDFCLAYSPEREDPGNQTFTTNAIPKLVAGHSPQCLKAAAALYGAVFSEVVEVSSCSIAEAAKLLENIYRAVNIALVNELKVMLTRMNIDVWEVIEAAKTKPFGFTPFYPGPGLGGHCIPIDPFYLTWRARQFGMNTRFIELAGEVNTAMPEYVIARVGDALNERGKPLNGSKVLVLGIAYKKDVDDLRESPSIVLIELLLAKGAVVSYNDPFVSAIPRMRQHDLQMASQKLTEESLAAADCVLIATDHSAYDYHFIGQHAQLLVDTRNAMSHAPEFAAKVWKA